LQKALSSHTLLLDYLEEKCIAGLTDEKDLDETFWERLIDEMNSLFSLVRFGIQG